MMIDEDAIVSPIPEPGHWQPSEEWVLTWQGQLCQADHRW